jgi:hypothetical protein
MSSSLGPSTRKPGNLTIGIYGLGNNEINLIVLEENIFAFLHIFWGTRSRNLKKEAMLSLPMVNL